MYLACPTHVLQYPEQYDTNYSQSYSVAPPSSPLSYSLDPSEPSSQPICTCSCSASIHLDVGFEVFMQVSTKSLGIMYSLLVSPEERTNIMFVVQISDLIRAKHGSHQISLPSMHSMAICRVNTCMYVVFALLVLALADTLLYTLPVVSQVAASLLRVYRRYLQVMMTRRRVQVSDVLLRSSMDLCLAQSPVSSSDRYL